MSDDFKSKYLEDYLAIWKDAEFRDDTEDLDTKYEELSKVIGEYAQLNNQFINIFNLKKQKVLFMSENYVEILGYNYSQEQYKKWSIFYWLRDLPLTQSYFILQLSQFYKKTISPLLNTQDQTKSLSWYMHNFQLKPPGAKRRHLGLTCSALEISKTGKLEIILIINNNIESQIKNTDVWWFDILVNNNEKYSYNSIDKKMVPKPILSDREKEILKLIENGKDTRSIAENLDLSPLTVEKHRKNMLDRTGAKDISMLLQICRFGNVI